MGENQNLYEKVEGIVTERFIQADKEPVLLHSRRTVYWLLQLKPDADEVLKIAALAHDIERASPPVLEPMVGASAKGWLDPEFLRRHSEKGARIIGELMDGLKADPGTIEQVKLLVAGHEFAGTEAQNVLKDADSVSFFENNVGKFVQLNAKKFGKKKVRAKFEWMYGRITSETAKQIVAPWYHRALEQLDRGDARSGYKL